MPRMIVIFFGLYLLITTNFYLSGADAQTTNEVDCSWVTVPKDVSILLDCAEEGFPHAQYYLGMKYELGVDVDKDPKASMYWYHQAATRGHVWAQYTMGNIYYFGVKVSQNFGQASDWYQLAAENGSASAQYQLGEMYRSGTGLDRNVTRAAHFFTLAAFLDYALAQQQLAILYATGDVVQTNLVAAYMWFSLAGDDASRVVLEEQMTYEQIAEAQQKASEWIKIHRQDS